MSTDALKMIANAMQVLGLAYGFGEYAGSPIVYPYFEGEYTETESTNEDGYHESSFILMGYSRGTWMQLETAKERIRTYFGGNSGRVQLTDGGNAVAVCYDNAQIVPVGEPELKRIQINLTVKEWRAD